MTDAELAFLEAASIATNDGAQLQLIQELRRTQKERDWLARAFGNLPDRGCPPSRRRWSRECRKTPCEQCWLEAAKEATCPKN